MAGALVASFLGGYAVAGPGAGGSALRFPPSYAPAALSDAEAAEIARTAEVRELLETRYARPVSDRVLEGPSAESIVERLGDPYTSLLSAGDVAALERTLAGRYAGLGLQISSAPKGFVITELSPGSAAQRAGIRRGDVITAIDGSHAVGLGVAEAADRLAGRAGSPVLVRVRGEQGEREVRLTRLAVESSTVTSQVVARPNGRILVVRVTRFSAGVAGAVRARVANAARHGFAGIVLDLRGNPGGLVDEAVGVCSVFLDGGVVAVTEGAHVRSQRLKAAGSGFTGLPLAVTVDGDTASSAEIVAAALAERRRATVVGGGTFGKTSVQEILPLAGGGALRITISHYRTPAGHDLHIRGLKPHVAVPPRDAVGRAVTLLLASRR